MRFWGRMRLIYLLSLLLTLHFHFVDSNNEENFTQALQKLRIEKGITDNHLKYDYEVEAIFRGNVPVEYIQSSDWEFVVDDFMSKNYGLLKGETEKKMDENKTYDQEFYKGMLNKIDETFTHVLYDPRYEKVAAIFFHEGTENTPFVIIFGGRLAKNFQIEDYVARHICFLRSQVMHYKYADELAPISNTLLNRVAKWATEGQEISKELTVVNIPIVNHEKQSDTFMIMKTLDSLFTQSKPEPPKEKLLLPTAQRLGAYVKEDESKVLVIVIESMATGDFVNRFWSNIKTSIGFQTGRYVVYTTSPDQRLNKMAECIANGYCLTSMSIDPPEDLAKKCGFDSNLFHGIFSHNQLKPEAYKKDDFQYNSIFYAVNDIFGKSETPYDPKNVRFGLGFALVAEETRTNYYWQVFAIFEHTGGAP